MKKVIALLMLLGMIVPVFAEKYQIGWYPYDYTAVIERQDNEYKSLSKEQQSVVDYFLEERFFPAYKTLTEGSYAEVGGQLLQLAQEYQELKEADPQVGRLVGGALAMIDLSSKERGKDVFFANLVMETAIELQDERLTDASNLVEFAWDLRQDYDSFWK